MPEDPQPQPELLESTLASNAIVSIREATHALGEARSELVADRRLRKYQFGGIIAALSALALVVTLSFTNMSNINSNRKLALFELCAATNVARNGILASFTLLAETVEPPPRDEEAQQEIDLFLQQLTALIAPIECAQP